jgi:hypothetical protein
LIKLTKNQINYLNNGATILIFPITYIDMNEDSYRAKKLYMKDMKDDIEFVKISGLFNKNVATFFNKKLNKDYYLSIPYIFEKLILYKDNFLLNELFLYNIEEIKIMKYNDFLKISNDSVYMNVETYNRNNVFCFEKHLKITTHMFSKYFDMDSIVGFKSFENPFILIYKIKKEKK